MKNKRKTIIEDNKGSAESWELIHHVDEQLTVHLNFKKIKIGWLLIVFAIDQD